MTKDEISKLPTPETDWFAEAYEGGLHVSVAIARPLERKLAAAVMVIERAMRVSDLSLDKEAVETLAAIRGDK